MLLLHVADFDERVHSTADGRLFSLSYLVVRHQKVPHLLHNGSRCRPQRCKKEHDVKVLKNPDNSCNSHLHRISINTSQNDAHY